MKQLLFSVVLALSWLPTTSLAGEVDLKIKGVGLDTSYSTVIRQLGKPLRKQQRKSLDDPCFDSPVTFMTLRYSGLIIGLLGDGNGRNFKVTSIEVTSSKWSVASEISVGADVKDVRARFGQPSRTEKESGLQLLHYVHKGDGGATFYFRANKLVKVAWNLSSC